MCSARFHFFAVYDSHVKKFLILFFFNNVHREPTWRIFCTFVYFDSFYFSILSNNKNKTCSLVDPQHATPHSVILMCFMQNTGISDRRWHDSIYTEHRYGIMSSSIRNSFYIVHKTCVKIPDWRSLFSLVVHASGYGC